MISDGITKQDFVIQILERDIANISKAQLLIAQHNIYLEGKNLKQRKRLGATLGSQSGNLLQSIQHPEFSISASGENFIVTNKIMLKLRFLDMTKLGNWRIYNRQVWGILYNNAMKDIRFRFGSAIYDAVDEALRAAFKKT